MRLADPGRHVPADDLAVGVFAFDLVTHQILGDDHVAFHPDHFGDVGNAARTVAQACRLDDDVDRAGDDLAHGLGRQREAAHGDHRFHTAQAFARRIGVDRTHRSVVTGVHRLKKVENFRSAHFTDDDTFGAHTQAVLHEVTHCDLAFAFDVRRACFKPHDMRLL
jgi:hypothetical protein